MPAQIPDSIAEWSATAGSNQPSGSANVGPDLDDNLRAMQAAVRQTYTRGSIASASTCDIGTVDAELITVTGTTTITSLGSTLGATGYGVHKLLTFAGALTLTHSASLACITSANITTAAGDSCMVEYSSSGWTMLWYARKTGAPVAVQSFALSDLSNATADKTLANGAFDQVWGWSGLGASDVGLKLTGASGSNQGTLLQLSGSGSGSGNPSKIFGVNGASASDIFTIYPGYFTLRPPVKTTAGSASDCTIGAGSADPSTGSVNGGTLYLYGGSGGNSSSTGGSVIIQPGSATATNGTATMRSSDSNSARVSVNTTAATIGGTTKLVLDQKHLFVDNTNGAPTITAGGGSGATIDGSDVAFEVTFGTGSPTSVTVTFANAWASAPLIQVSGTQSGQILHYASATNTVQILSSTAFSSGTKVSVFCIGKQ